MGKYVIKKIYYLEIINKIFFQPRHLRDLKYFLIHPYYNKK